MQLRSRSANTPSFRLGIILPNDPCGQSSNQGVIRDASRHYRIGGDHTITTYCQLPLGTQDDGPTADPTSLANSDSATLRNTLFHNRDIYIFISMIVVHNQNPLGDEHVTFYVDEVPRGDNRVGTYSAIILNNDRGLIRGVRVRDIKPRILSQRYRITKTDSRRVFSAQDTREMQIQLSSS
jgi:hypothetical protein